MGIIIKPRSNTDYAHGKRRLKGSAKWLQKKKEDKTNRAVA